jgi:cytochrome d ubiquinol oxidase subunit I
MTVWSLADPPDLLYARSQMALSLGWHIVIASFGVAFPALVIYAEARSYRNGDPDLLALARTWAKAMGVLFAVGAVSGTILSFEMGILWPGLMSRFGEVYGFPFTLEGFAFFLEAIFVGVYLFGWERLPPWTHVVSGIPMVVAGAAGAFFVVAANAWMNTPQGFVVRDGEIVDTNPWAAMFNPSTGAQAVHMVLAAWMVAGFCVASVYAVGSLRGRRGRYQRLGLMIPLTAAALATPVQIGVGDWIAETVAHHQPVKLAAMEALSTTRSEAPLSLGGIYVDGELRGAIEIPYGLSLLVARDPRAEVPGLDRVVPELRPPVNMTHLSYNAMIGIGMLLLLLSAWLAGSWWRRRDLPPSAWFLRAVAVSGVASVVALETGWIATEVGRQPWIVYEIQLTRDAVSTAPGLRYAFFFVVVVYLVLTGMTVFVLRRLSQRGDVHAPYAPDRDERREIGAGAP